MLQRGRIKFFFEEGDRIEFHYPINAKRFLYFIVFKKQMLQVANTDLFNPLVWKRLFFGQKR